MNGKNGIHEHKYKPNVEKKNAIVQQTQHVIEISVCPATFSCPPAFRAHSIFPVEISPGVPKNMIRWLTITTVIPMHSPNNEIIMQYAIFMLVFNLFKNQSCVSSFTNWPDKENPSRIIPNVVISIILCSQFVKKLRFVRVLMFALHKVDGMNN